MNKKILRKLTLSAVTLGVAALSVTTSTFAWFTTNGSASASEVKGTVQSANANMLIKTNTSSGYTDFKNSVTFMDGSTSLVPVTWSKESNTEAFHKAGQTVGEFKETVDLTKDVLHYEVVFGITNLPTSIATVTANFTNFTIDKDGTQYLLVDAYSTEEDGKTMATAGTTIKVNLLDVLSLRVTSTVISSDLSTYGIKDSADNLVQSITSTNANYRYKEEVPTLTTSTSSTVAGNAIDYYKNVYGSVLTGNMTKPNHSETSQGSGTYNDGYSNTVLFTPGEGSSSDTFNDITLFTVTAGIANKTVYVKTDFYFYIDGWDYQCFNCVGGLTLSGGVMNFKLS